MTIIYFIELTLDQSARVFQGRQGIILIWQYLPAMFPNLISFQKWKQKSNCWHRIQNLKSETGWQNNALVTYMFTNTEQHFSLNWEYCIS